MRTNFEDKVTKTKMLHLYKHVGVLTIAHPIFGLMLCALFWSKVETHLVLQWFAALSLIVLARGLNFFRFQRTAQNGVQLERYENYSLIFSTLIGICYSVAFSYLTLALSHDSLATIALIAAMLTAVSTIGYTSSLKSALVFSMPILLSLIALIAYQQTYVAYSIAGILSMHSLLLFRTIKPVTDSLTELFELRIKHDEAEKQIEKIKDKFESFTVEDVTTRIFNRRFFDLTLNNEIRRAKRMRNDLALVILDIDSFHEYNEMYGQEAGDKCLGAVAGLLKASVHRGGEFVTRFEGDQFALILPNVTVADAERFALKLQDIILKANIQHEGTKVADLDRISISAGVTEFAHGRPLDRKEIIAQAQDALFEAKEQGGCAIVARHRIEETETVTSSARTGSLTLE